MKYLYGKTTVWGIPGGGINEGESLTDTLKRELDEELGVTVRVGDLICLVETPPAGKVKHTLHCIFTGMITEGIPQVNLEHTSALAVEWVEAEALDTMTLYPPINDAVKQAVSGDVNPQYLGKRERQWF